LEELGKEEECVIYSIGSDDSWGFEEDMAKRTKCRIETFDCTVRDHYDS
jgi:hypothetical protein